MPLLGIFILYDANKTTTTHSERKKFTIIRIIVLNCQIWVIGFHAFKVMVLNCQIVIFNNSPNKNKATLMVLFPDAILAKLREII